MEYHHSQQASSGIVRAANDAFESLRSEAASQVHFAQMAAVGMFESIRAEQTRPSVVYRPDLSLDGNKWSALYGANLMEGVCGWGDSPDEAMADFDRRWITKVTP